MTTVNKSYEIKQDWYNIGQSKFSPKIGPAIPILTDLEMIKESVQMSPRRS